MTRGSVRIGGGVGRPPAGAKRIEVRARAERAVRAIRRCQPLRVEGIDHARWKDITITFDPRPALSGR